MSNPKQDLAELTALLGDDRMAALVVVSKWRHRIETEARAELADQVEPILAILHHRGIVDSQNNRDDVEHALTLVRQAIEATA